MKRASLVLLVVVALIVSLACNFLSPKSTPEVEDVETPEVETGGGKSGGDGFTVTVRNATSNDEICYVLISSSDEQAWGEDWLGDSETIGAGSSMSFDVTGSGEHDVMLQNCEGVTLGTAWQLSSDSTVTIGGSGLVKMEVYNESATEVCYIYISPSTNDNWGEDWLGAKESIAAQEGMRFFYVEPGAYDLLAQDCDGNDLVQETGVEISDGTTWTITD